MNIFNWCFLILYFIHISVVSQAATGPTTLSTDGAGSTANVDVSTANDGKLTVEVDIAI